MAGKKEDRASADAKTLEYVEAERAYFYTADDRNKIVELRVDTLYKYDDDDNKFSPKLRQNGGNTSV